LQHDKNQSAPRISGVMQGASIGILAYQEDSPTIGKWKNTTLSGSVIPLLSRRWTPAISNTKNQR